MRYKNLWGEKGRCKRYEGVRKITRTGVQKRIVAERRGQRTAIGESLREKEKKLHRKKGGKGLTMNLKKERLRTLASEVGDPWRETNADDYAVLKGSIFAESSKAR